MNTKLNKSDFILLGFYFLISFILQGHQYVQRKALLREYFVDFSMEIIMICGIIFFFIFYLIPKFVDKKKYVIFLIYGLAVMVFLASIDYVLGYWSGKNDWSKFPKGIDFVFQMIDRATFQSAFPFAILLTKKFYEGKNELLKIKTQQKESELKLLRSQLDPHFLFNNLNTLDSLIDSDSEKAKTYLNRLSHVYRYLIQTKDAEVMELERELEFSKHYLFLIETRFGNDYQFNITKTGSLVDTFIPTGALQVVLENVVKHNKAKKESSIVTHISINSEYVMVSNKKSMLTIKKDSLGTGLKNLKARYRFLSDQPILIKENQTHYLIKLPVLKLSKA